VSVHWQPETGAVREYNHFSIIKVYVIIHGYRLTFRGGFQLISHIFNLITLNFLKTFNHWAFINLILIQTFKIIYQFDSRPNESYFLKS
jgi:hypothetical protein